MCVSYEANSPLNFLGGEMLAVTWKLVAASLLIVLSSTT